ncbi:macro domain-containing protein [Hyphomicrobium sp.]|uniref:macro domain-containing protein n=1 Tax=Hyphomicrobium sp. TaxID=82 RepID=UPI001D305A8A|nr:macro domain-containing protein [Hyphomicrobium sp.]MBY0561439.1 macro domain-containing protein [Hyphomicrobium sp.]
MPVTIVKDDMFESKAEAYCNPVNCFGVMGAGLAKEFWLRYPDRCIGYKNACQEHTLEPGRVLSHADGRRTPRTIFHVATKDHWSRPSKIEWIVAAAEILAERCKQLKIKSIAIPALGCGKGGLAWPVVKKVIEKAFGTIAPEVEVELYPPHTDEKVKKPLPKPASRNKDAKVV